MHIPPPPKKKFLQDVNTRRKVVSWVFHLDNCRRNSDQIGKI